MLADPRARNRLVGLVLALTGAALLRTWVVLLGLRAAGRPRRTRRCCSSRWERSGCCRSARWAPRPTATVAAMGATRPDQRRGGGHGDRHLDGSGGAALRRGMLGLAGTLRRSPSVSRPRSPRSCRSRSRRRSLDRSSIWPRSVLLQGIHVREGAERRSCSTRMPTTTGHRASEATARRLHGAGHGLCAERSLGKETRSSIAGGLESGREEFVPSARNLAFYLALRHHDLRDLQLELMPLGLSSLGRCEARVMPSLDAVLAAARKPSVRLDRSRRSRTRTPSFAGTSCSAPRPRRCSARPRRTARSG